MDLTVVSPNFFNFDVGYIINKPVLFFLFLFYLVFYIAVSSVLIYHWSNYGMKSKGIVAARALFIFVSIFLLVVTGLTVYYF